MWLHLSATPHLYPSRICKTHDMGSNHGIWPSCSLLTFVHKKGIALSREPRQKRLLKSMLSTEGLCAPVAVYHHVWEDECVSCCSR
jgi:hypothetical protein